MILMIIFSALLGGCSSTRVVLDVPAIVKDDIQKLKSFSSRYEVGKWIRGSACTYSILSIPISKSTTINDAIKDAIKDEAGVVGLIDLEISTSVFFTYLYNYSCYEIAGNKLLKRD